MWDSYQRDLWKLDFPDCAEKALDLLKQHYKREIGGDDNIPGLGGGTEEMSTQIVEDFIFVHNSQNRHNKQARGAMIRPGLQELRSLELIIKLYTDLQKEKVPDTISFSIFQTLFWCAAKDRQRLGSLSKLISLAVSMGCGLALDSAALWMQLQGAQTSCVQFITQSLITDYSCMEDNKLADLPKLSKHFACIFISSAVTIYKYPGPAGVTKYDVYYNLLLPMITNWVLDDPHLCLISLVKAQHVQSLVQPAPATLWTSPTKPNTHTPIPGLVRWATQGPLKNLDLPKSDSPQTDNFKNEHKLTELYAVWSKLHLGILQIVTVFTTMPGSSQLEMITLVDMKKILDELVLLVPWGVLDTGDDEPNPAHREIVETCMDRMIQILQLTLATGAFRCSLADLKQICDVIPQQDNRLKQILESQHLSNNPPAMHNAS